MRVTKTAVIEVASDLIDKNGLSGVSLKSVADALGIRTPSLYNHIESLDDMIREVAHAGMQEMNMHMLNGSIGKMGEDAIKSVSVCYLEYMIQHPGIYEAIQWAGWHQSEKTKSLNQQYESLMMTLIRSMGYEEKDQDAILRLLTCTLHGYTTMQLRYAFDDPERVISELTDAVDTVWKGIMEKYSNRERTEI